MRLRSNGLILASLLFFLADLTARPQVIELQLAAPTYAQCVEKSHSLGRRLTAIHYLRGVALTASATIALYVAYNFFMGEETSKKFDVPAVPPVAWLSWQTAQNLGWWLAKACAQTICGQWVAQKFMANRGDPKHFIAQHMYGYKTHCTEIERLLALRPADPYAEIDLLIQAHLQGLIDKLELLMAYMIYYAGARVSESAAVRVDAYAQEVLKKAAITVAHFNATYVTNFDAAVNECKTIYAEQLTSAIRYALSSLPSDE